MDFAKAAYFDLAFCQWKKITKEFAYLEPSSYLTADTEKWRDTFQRVGLTHADVF